MTLAELGGIDVLVNSGIYYGASGMNLFVDTPMQEYREAFAANVLAPDAARPARRPVDARARRGAGRQRVVGGGPERDQGAARRRADGR